MTSGNQGHVPGAMPEGLPPPPHDSGHFLRGTAWMVAMRFGVRGIGLFSTILLARLLTPADFGVVAMAMLLIAFIEVFSETGQALALIRHPNPQRAHYDTAWTMSILINTCLTVILLILAPFSTAYFGDERIVPVIQVLSLRILLAGFVNIGVVNFRRDLNFSMEFKFGLYRKLLTFGVTLTLALLWRNYWALVIGAIVGHFLEVLLSYLMHAYRPRFGLEKVAELWSYSIWLLVAALGRFFEGRIDGVVVAGIAPPSAVGEYTVAAELGGLPVSEILEPVARGLFPNYTRVASQPNGLRDSYLQVLAAISTIAIAVGVGIALVADDMVAVLLGPNWTNISPLVAWFAIEASIVGICNSVFPVLNAAGESRRSAIQTWIRVALYVPALVWAASTAVLLNFAIAKVAASILLAPSFFIRLRQVIPIPWSMLLGTVWRPAIAALAMTAAVITSRDLVLQIDSAGIRLLADVVIGASVFVTAQLALWLACGRPEGVENSTLKLMRQALA
jgi:lipopolysaccharide exporter